MGEIKSAIELAMERTKNLVMDEEEKRTLAIKDTENKIRAILRRYLEDMVEKDDAEKELGEIRGDEALKRSLLADLLVEKFDIQHDNTRLLQLFHMINGGLEQSLKKELKMLQKQFAEEMEKREMIIRERIMDNLKETGITGSGIEPNIAEWDAWKGELEEVGNTFQRRVTEWKNRLKGTTD
ncbi:MAG: hypothetical protein NTU90_01720 [Proteobacteria bacterium]|nr:hypothetical protein [Pseudomonadota bacterium]